MGDYRFCPVCGGMIEAGSDSTCTCEDDEYSEFLHEQVKDKILDEKWEQEHAHELINKGGL